MTRFQKVISILDQLVGGPTAPVNPPHFAFWRGLTRDAFVVKKVFGLPLVAIGDGAGSNLVKALKGETPFGADIGNPDADFNRMPSGKPPASNEDIQFIKRWIDEGCLDDELAAELEWRKTNAPVASSRTDDIWFADPQTGWAVNSDGNIIHTSDGGSSWTVQHAEPATYLRCIGFANLNVGWVGSLRRTRRLFHTTDGGAQWNLVSSLPAGAPVKICGMSVVNENVVYCSGTNDPQDFPRMMKTVDGGATWTALEMSAHASILIDCFFVDALHGWVVGGKADQPTPTTRDRVRPVVLETIDGGVTWTDRVAGQAGFPLGEWGWKIQFLNNRVGFVSLENFTAGAILKTTNGGMSWTRHEINDQQHNVNLEGVGFVDEQHGWVGGWGPGGFGGAGSATGASSATLDGGQTWTNANQIGAFLNRFRFFGNPVSVGFASGDTIYKYSSDPAPLAPDGLLASATRGLLPEAQILGAPGGASIELDVPAGTRRLTLYGWDRFGLELGILLDEISPTAGRRTFDWDGTNSAGDPMPPGDYIVRMIADDRTASTRVILGTDGAIR